MILIVGLGNPGEKYEKTRHNVGFIALERLANELGATYKVEKKFKSEVATVNTEFDQKIILAKPQTYMNLSGEAVSTLAKFYGINFPDIWVIHDDIDIDLGKIRIRRGGSSAGQKGVQSIISQLGTPEFVRFRVGIKPEGGLTKPAEDFVLRKFRKSEQEVIDEEIEKIIEIIKEALRSGLKEETI